MSQEAEYVLGTDEAEHQRLGLQHRLWADLAHRTWRSASIRPGARVLDVGSGPGYAAFDLAQLVGPAGRVIAVDESARFIERLRREAEVRGLTNIEAHVHDVQRLEALPIDPGTIDLAYCRWVLCFVPDPGSVVRGVTRALRAGGCFAVNDYFNYESMTIAPRHPAFAKGITATGASWRSRGGDPDIIGRLPALMSREGLRLLRLEVDQRIARPGDSMWEWPEAFWKNYIPRLVESGHMTLGEADAFMVAWREASADPNRFMALPPVFEVVAVKEPTVR